MLLPEEYIEQAFFFESFIDSIEDGVPTQEFLFSIRSELLTSAQLHKAVDFMLTDAKYTGVLASSMQRLSHYFSPFQTFVISESEREYGHLDFKIALQILAREAKYRSSNPTTQGIFFYQFETICRNRLGYIRGVGMLIEDDFYNDDWKEWLKILRRQIGFVPLADLIFYRSEYYKIYQSQIHFHTPELLNNSHLHRQPNTPACLSENELPNSSNTEIHNKIHSETNSIINNQPSDIVTLFGEREGRIAFATRNKEPAYLFSALSRHLGYPSVPRKKNVTEEENIVPLLKRRIEQLENRIQLIEEEQRGGINLNKYIKK
jgi:hypothetical protein